jgi:hypothetical protein
VEPICTTGMGIMLGSRRYDKVHITRIDHIYDMNIYLL